MRYLSIILLGLATATSVCCLPEQEHFADLVSSQPVHTTEGWSYEDCGLSMNVFCYCLLTFDHLVQVF